MHWNVIHLIGRLLAFFKSLCVGNWTVASFLAAKSFTLRLAGNRNEEILISYFFLLSAIKGSKPLTSNTTRVGIMMRIDADLWFLEAQLKIGFVAKRVAEKFLSRNATELGRNFCGAFTFLLKKVTCIARPVKIFGTNASKRQIQ